MNKTLIYIRPWNKFQFTRLAKDSFPETEVVSCSEHKGFDQSGMRSAYYQNLKIQNISFLEKKSGLEASIRFDMIKRCRLLRSLDGAIAEQHLLSMACAVKSVFENWKPKIVLSLVVDSFVIDLLRHYSEQNKCLFLGLVPTFVKNTFRISSRGERTFNPAPEVDATELQDLLGKLLSVDYTPAFNKSSVQKPWKGIVRRWTSNIIRPQYFFLKRILSGDYYNYHYWSSQIVSMQHKSYALPFGFGEKNWNQKLKSDSRPSLFIPLQMFPECTIDYWAEDLESVEYYQTLEDFIKNHGAEINILVKEHPAVFPSRPASFYEYLNRDERVTVVPTYAKSNDILNLVDSVLIWTGTVGFEALLRGKPVVSFCQPYYAEEKYFFTINKKTTTEDILQYITSKPSHPITDNEQLMILEYLSRQLFKGNFKNNGSWNKSVTEDMSDLRQMVDSLKRITY